MRDSPLVDYLLDNREDRAMMAALRRGLGRREGHVAMYPFVIPYMPKEEHRSRYWIYFTVAALFGYHHDPLAKRVSMGEAMSRLERNDSLEKRFLWLLDSEVEELPKRLKSVVSLLKSKGVGLDYHRLFYDLFHWEHPDHFVQLRWAEDFFADKTDDKTKE